MSEYESFTQCQNKHGPSIEVMIGYEKSLRPFKTGSLMLAVVVLLLLFPTCSFHSSTSTPFCKCKDYVVLRLCYSHRVVLCWAFAAGRWGICRTCHLGLVSGLLPETRGDSPSKSSSPGHPSDDASGKERLSLGSYIYDADAKVSFWCVPVKFLKGFSKKW